MDIDMDIEIRPEAITALTAYGAIPIAFEVAEVYDVTAAPDGGAPFVLTAHPVVAYIKDYDARDAEGPAGWPQRFDIMNWGFFAAYADGQRIGGAAVAYATPAVDMLEGRLDLAALWDIRVAPVARRGGVGTALFRAAERWASAKGCRQLKVETQNINVAACTFYARQGCNLRAVQRGVYPGLPNEIQFLWYKDLVSSATAG